MNLYGLMNVSQAGRDGEGECGQLCLQLTVTLQPLGLFLILAHAGVTCEWRETLNYFWEQTMTEAAVGLSLVARPRISTCVEHGMGAAQGFLWQVNSRPGGVVGPW